MFLLAVTYAKLFTFKVTRPLVHELVLYLPCFCTCCAIHLIILRYQAYLCMIRWHTMYVRFLMFEPCLVIFGILFGSCEKLMDYPILGECYAWAFHNPKIVCT